MKLTYSHVHTSTKGIPVPTKNIRRRLAWTAVAVTASVSLAGTTVHADEPTTLVSVAGDIACGTKIAAYHNGDGTATACHQKYTGELLPGSDQVWTLGDHVYPSATLVQFNGAYQPYGWGQMKAVTKPSPGDHDYANAGGKGYFAYFGVPPYYSFDVNGWHVISLNSEVDHSAGSAQEQWLQTDLTSTTSNCIAAYWGEARFSSGKKGNNVGFDPFWQDLYAAHADLALVGDTHNYERLAKMAPDESAAADGVREFVVGTGGRSLVGFPITTRQPTSEKRIKSFGVLQLTLQDGSYSWQFVNEASTVLDSGSDSCN